MAVSRIALLLICFLIGNFVVADEPKPHSAPTQTSGPEFQKEVEKQTFLLVNQYRKESGLPPLTWSDAIAKVARGHSKDMATGEVDFGHDGFSDRVSQVKASLPGVWGAGENVLYTGNLDDVANQAVTMWLHSPRHLKNIRGEYNYSGIGVWQNQDGTIYFTQLFVNVKAPVQETEAKPAVVTPFGLLASPETRTSR
jgi:uncharacterized protein YkwD